MARFYKLYLFLFPVSILFLIFVPKLNSFWTLPSPNIAKTGLSESVDPFKINELSQSDDLAFRVIFNNTSKNNFPMYWRTIIHDKFDGSQWHVSNGQSQFLKTKHTRSNFTYTIIAEPSNLPWLYGLNDSYSPSPNIQTNVHGTLINTKGNYKKIEYKVNTLKKKSIVLSRYEHINNTYVPNNSNPKMQALSKELAQGSQNVGEYIIKMKQFFLDNNFVYSLTPPNLSSNNPIDEFLFDTNIGFCGHYASSAAALLRTAGIPARLVSGYLGGELNSDGYYTVYQYDAHAWVEYYSQNYGWRRLDPTAWVSPDRLLGSLSQVEDLNDDFNEYMGLSLVRFSNIRVISWVRRQLETLDYNWTRSVLNFNKEKQENLLVKLFGNHSNLFPGLFIIVFFLICILTYYILVNYKQRDKQPLIVMYFKLLISHLPDYSSDMTPHQIITQLKTKYPTKVEQLSQFYRLYAKNRYQEIHLNKVSLQSCKDLISDLNKIDKKTPI